MDNGGFWIAPDNHLVCRVSISPPTGQRGGGLTRRPSPLSSGPASGNVTTATLAPSGPLPQTIEAAISATTEEMC